MLFQFLKTFITDCMFHATSINFCNLWINSNGYKLMSKKTMAFVNFFSHIPAKFCQVQIMLFIHCQKTALSQSSYCVTYAGF